MAPNALNHFHRVLITVASLFFLGFGVYSFRQGTGAYVAIGVASIVAAAGMMAYLLFYFNRKVRSLQVAQDRAANADR